MNEEQRQSLTEAQCAIKREIRLLESAFEVSEVFPVTIELAKALLEIDRRLAQ